MISKRLLLKIETDAMIIKGYQQNGTYEDSAKISDFRYINIKNYFFGIFSFSTKLTMFLTLDLG